VPVDVVNRVVPEIIRHGRVIRPGIGITVASERIVERFEINGVLIINVQPGGAAEQAGIHGTSQINGKIILGDIIQAVNGEAVETYNDLRNEIDKYHIGDEVTLLILRDEEHLQVSLRLEEIE